MKQYVENKRGDNDSCFGIKYVKLTFANMESSRTFKKQPLFSVLQIRDK